MIDRKVFPSVDEEDSDPEYVVSVSVKCPFCPRNFSGGRYDVEEELFLHLWKVHEDDALAYMLSNMYIPDEIRERIFSEMGPDYVSWVVDSAGEVQEDI